MLTCIHLDLTSKLLVDYVLLFLYAKSFTHPIPSAYQCLYNVRSQRTTVLLIILPPAQKVDSNAIVEIGIARISAATPDKILYFKWFASYHLKGLKRVIFRTLHWSTCSKYISNSDLEEGMSPLFLTELNILVPP